MRDTTLLIVEDDHEIRARLADFLGREGFVIETTETGAGMDRLLARITPDLVVLDNYAPGRRWAVDLSKAAGARQHAAYPDAHGEG